MDSTKHEIICDLKRVALELGKIPTRDEYRERTSISMRVLCREFENYSVALRAAGLVAQKDPQKQQKKFKWKEQKLESFTVHEIDLAHLFELAGNPEVLKIVAQPDTHVKYRDKKAVSVFLQFMNYYRPHGHLIMGDFLDAEGISHWPSSDLEPRRFVPEVIEGRELLAAIVAASPETVLRAYLSGNHEKWLELAMAQKLPELFDGLDELGLDLNLQKLLDLDKFGYQFFELNHFVKIGKAYYTHGLCTGDNHAKKHLDKVKDNIYYGHLHDTKSYVSTSIRGKIEAHSLACLCRLDAKFLKGNPNNWGHGFGVFEFLPDGSYTFYLPRINNGLLAYNGKLFIGEE